jgi:hypothetical protein
MTESAGVQSLRWPAAGKLTRYGHNGKQITYLFWVQLGAGRGKRGCTGTGVHSMAASLSGGDSA